MVSLRNLLSFGSPRSHRALESVVSYFKVVLFVLLAANTAYFAIAESASKGLDAAAWLALLLLFAAETSFPHRLTTPRRRLAVRAARLVAGAGVIVATLAYILEENVLDAVNSVLWILVVVMLEVQLRRREAAARYRHLFAALATVLYGGLAVLVLLWAAAGLWLDAYDAVLWLVAFVAIELAVTRRENAPVMTA